jgi:uncharacterized protein (TIGR03067 family)
MSLPGKWRPVRAELDGQPAPDLALEQMEFHLTTTDYAVHFANEIYDRGTFIHTATTLHLTAHHGPNAGRVITAIYQLAGDRLRICYGLDGTAPTDFKTAPNSCRYLVTYRRHTG